MLVERKPLEAESEAFVHVQGRHPLRHIPVHGKRQTEAIIHLPFIIEVELCDVHEVTQIGNLRHGLH